MAKKLIFLGDIDRCFICKTNYNLETHHVMNGPYKKASEKHGLLIKVCPNCHTMAANSIHRDSLLRKRLKQVGQEQFEMSNTREEFIKVFGKSYL